MNISLKSQNMPMLIALSIASYFLFSFFKAGEFSIEEWTSASLDYSVLGPSMAILLLGVGLVNSLLSNEAKEFLVFFKVKHALPGHQAFSKHALNDSRVDISEVEKIVGSLPEDAAAQNKTWYTLYKRCRDIPSVKDANKSYLLYRDCTSLVVLLTVIYGVWGYYVFPGYMTLLSYVIVNLLLWFLFSHAARNHACKLVCNVLAEACD